MHVCGHSCDTCWCVHCACVSHVSDHGCARTSVGVHVRVLFRVPHTMDHATPSAVRFKTGSRASALFLLDRCPTEENTRLCQFRMLVLPVRSARRSLSLTTLDQLNTHGARRSTSCIIAPFGDAGSSFVEFPSPSHIHFVWTSHFSDAGTSFVEFPSPSLIHLVWT